MSQKNVEVVREAVDALDGPTPLPAAGSRLTAVIGLVSDHGRLRVRA